MVASADARSGDGGETLGRLADRLGHTFADPGLLERALSHRSWCAEHDDAASNERLEFLGDAVLGWVIADLAYRRFEEAPEGGLTDLRKSVVNATALADVARTLRIGDHIRLGRGEAAAGGADKPSILSDAFEAILGAIYLDGGTDAVRDVVERHVGPGLELGAAGPLVSDHKTHLQELCAAAGVGAPQYELSAAGPDHRRIFTATVVVDGSPLGSGQGPSKKTAEQAAAAVACAEFEASA